MAKKEMAIRATPQNPLLGAVSRGLGSLRSGMGGVGDFLIGRAPEEIEDWSYGFSPFKENPSGSRIPIEVRPGREEGLMDTLGLPVAETYGLARLAGAGAKKAIGKAISGATEEGRREFLKKAGQVAAGGAAAVAAPDLVKAIGKEITPAVKKLKSVKVIGPSPEGFFNIMEGITNQAWKASNDAFNKMSLNEYENLAQKLLNLPNSERWVIDEGDIGGATMGEKAVKDHLFDMYQKELHDKLRDKLRENPSYKPYIDGNYIRPGGHIDMLNDIKNGQSVDRVFNKGGSIENTTHYRKII